MESKPFVEQFGIDNAESTKAGSYTIFVRENTTGGLHKVWVNIRTMRARMERPSSNRKFDQAIRRRAQSWVAVKELLGISDS